MSSRGGGSNRPSGSYGGGGGGRGGYGGGGGRGGGGGAAPAQATAALPDPLKLPSVPASQLPKIDNPPQKVLPQLFGGSRQRLTLPSDPEPAQQSAAQAHPTSSASASASAPAKAGGPKSGPPGAQVATTTAKAPPAKQQPGNKKGPQQPAATEAQKPTADDENDKKTRLLVEQRAKRSQEHRAALDSIEDSIAQVQHLKGGTDGARKDQLTNFFPVKYGLNNTSFYQYAIASFTSDKEMGPRSQRMATEYMLQQHKQGVEIVYAHKTIFTRVPLHDPKKKGPQENAKVEVVIEHKPQAEWEGRRSWRGMKHTLVLSYAKTIDPSPGTLDTEQYRVLTEMFSNAFHRGGFLRINDSFYDVDQTYAKVLPVKVDADAAQNLALLRGIKVKLLPAAKGGVLLNVDLAIRTCRTENVFDHLAALKRYHSANGLKGDFAAFAKGELLGTRCGTTYIVGGRHNSFTIDDVDFSLTAGSSFVLKSGEKTTYAEYFSRKYGITNIDSKQPLLVHKVPGQTNDDGTPIINRFLPQLTYICGQSKKMLADQRLQQELKRQCILPPQTRFAAISEIVAALCKNDAFTGELRRWGIEVDPRMISAPTRVLNPPPLSFGGGKPVAVNDKNRSWLVPKKTTLFGACTAPKKWAVMYPRRMEAAALTAFLDSLMTETLNGMTGSPAWPRPQQWPYTSHPSNANALMGEMQQLDEDLDFCLVVLGGQDEVPYEEVKRLTLLDWKIPSQCVILKNASRPDKVQLLNVTSRLGGQMMVKTGGELWSAANPMPDALIVHISFASGKAGASAESNATAPKVACLVAASGPTLSPLSAESAVVKKTVGDTVAFLMENALKAFKKKHNRDCKFVVAFRPGMNEGDIPKIVHDEVLPLQVMAKKSGFELAFMTSLKRCNARVYPAPPGTIIDEFILPGTGFSFLLIPQKVNMGTATAMKFSLLSWPSQLPKDKLATFGERLQQLAYASCHTYQGWWGSTREPGGVMYAQRQADLHARLLVTGSKKGAQGTLAAKNAVVFAL